MGTVDLQVPKLREGSYFPALLEPRRRSERALLAVVQQAYVEGVSTRRVDDLVQALGCEGISKSQVSRICSELDVVVGSFLGRPLDDGPYRYLWLDALTQKVREGGRIVLVSVVVATAVNAEGKREMLGIDVGTSEDGAFWLGFLRGLVARGLSGVELVTSDAHEGLKDAIATVFGEASWQRCRTHFMANLLTRVPKSAQSFVATMVRTIYQQPSAQEVWAQHARVVEQLAERFPEAAELLAKAAPEILAFTAFPVAHWRQVWSNNPPGAAEQGDPPAHQRRRHLPEPPRDHPPRRRGPRRAARRVGRRPTLHDDGHAPPHTPNGTHDQREGAATNRDLSDAEDGTLLHHLPGRDPERPRGAGRSCGPRGLPLPRHGSAPATWRRCGGRRGSGARPPPGASRRRPPARDRVVSAASAARCDGP